MEEARIGYWMDEMALDLNVKFFLMTKSEHDPVSTMQKTGWTIHSPFLVLFGLKKHFTLDVITRGQATTIFLCIGPFSAW